MRRILGLVLGLAPILVQAAPVALSAEIPFEFHVGNALMPAGKYTISPHGQQVLRVESADRKNLAVAMSVPAQLNSAATDSRLLFNRYGDQYFLSRIAIVGGTSGQELVKARLERELVKRAAHREIASVPAESDVRR